MILMVGKLHSIESMGLVDGPGIRTVVFLQGCSLRCRFCHNPDTWPCEGGFALTPEELVTRVLRFAPYFLRSGGGVTFSGGEPLLQPEFLLQALHLLKANGIHTCLDTAGVGLGRYDELLALTDLVLYDVKHTDSAAYLALTGRDIAETERFQAALRAAKTPVWVRQVVLPGSTDSTEYLTGLKHYLATQLPAVQRVELLPYHRLGVNKYQPLGIPYPLGDLPPMDKARCAALQREYFGNE